MLDNKIKIAMLELSDENRAVLEFYFSGAEQKLFSAVSEDQADALIIDYDLPGAADTVSEKLKTSDKPIVLLTTEEQNLSSTICLIKPLTTEALSQIATALNKVIVSKQAALAVEAEEILDSSIDNSIETQASETTKDGEAINDIFNKLTEADVQLDKNKKIQARLAMPATEALVSASASSQGNTDLPRASEDESFSEISNLELADILLDNNDTQTEEDNLEDEVDALLESLISNEDHLKEADEVGKDSVTNETVESINEGELSLKEFSLHDESLKETELENKAVSLEISQQNDNDSDSIDLLAESILVESSADQHKVFVEKESLSVDENFIMHDDLNPSQEEVFADTLEVKYEDIKDEHSIQDQEDTGLEKTLEEASLADDASLSSGEDINSVLDELELETQSDNTISEKDTDLDKLLEEFSLAEDDISSVEEEFNSELNKFESETPPDNTIIEENTAIEDEDSNIENFIEEDFNSPSQSELDDQDDFDLQSLLNEIREEATGEPASDDDSTSELQHTNTEKRWALLSGSNNDIKVQKDLIKLSFNPKNHLLGVLLEQVKTNKKKEQLYRLKYGDLIILLDHSKDIIYCNFPITEDEFSDICFTEIEQEKVKIHDLDYSEIKLYQNKIKENPDRVHSIESFIWSMSLLTSRGRLPEKTNISQKIGLKVWPNMTRVELPPHAMRIAAVLSKHPGNLLEIAEWMGIEQRHVFAFYNGALNLDILDFYSSKIKKQGLSSNKKNTKDKPQQNSFFGRLFKKVKS